MATPQENRDYARDSDDVDVLHGIENMLAEAKIQGISGIGPVDIETGTCPVLIENVRGTQFPESLTLTLKNKRSISLKLVAVQDDNPVRLLSGPVPPPWQYSGPLMAGDPIWNDAASQWGTIGIVLDGASSVQVEGNAAALQCVTCNHVLDIPGATTASTRRYPTCADVAWNIVPPQNGKWLDVAGAKLRPGVSFKALEVRGLRQVKSAQQPRRGIRVSKYGATTGLTSGRDLGWTKLKLVPGSSALFWVRRVGGYFAKVGDSGAPVLDADRNLVGLIVAGRPGVRDETYYVPFLPAGQTPSQNASVPNLSFYNISGL